MIRYLDKENFDELTKKKVLVDFYADWCGPCKMLGSVLEDVQEELDIDIIKVNVDTHDELARKYGVMSIPTLILFENNKEIKKHTGFLDQDKIKDFTM